MKNTFANFPLMLLLITTVSIYSCQVSKTTDGMGTGYQYGSQAVGFSLLNIDSNMVSTDDYPNAKGFVVVFTCNHCPYAKAYEERLVTLNDYTTNLGYPILAINPNNPKTYPSDDFNHMVKRASEKGFNFPYLVDEGQKIYPVYGATKTPHVYLLNKENNKLMVRYIGAIDDNYEDAGSVTKKYVEEAVSALSEGHEVEIKQTKAIGCSIKS
jgi:peroxiredoxin